MPTAWRVVAADGGHAFEPVERPIREPEGDEIAVAVHAAVVGDTERNASADDIVPGGAAVGEVVAAGENATHLLGKRVLVGPEQPCGECDVCRRGGACVCPSGQVLGRDRDGCLAERVIARARWACHLGEGLELPGPEAALAAREAAWAYAMYARAGVSPGSPVIIVGDGIVARLTAQVALARGCRPIVVPTEVATEQPAWVAALELRAATGGELATRLDETRRLAADAGHGDRPWFLFETTGRAEGAACAAGLVRPRATAALLAPRALGRPPTGRGELLDAIVAADGVAVGIAGAHPDLLPEVAALAVRGDLDLRAAAATLHVGDGLAADVRQTAAVVVVDPSRAPRA